MSRTSHRRLPLRGFLGRSPLLERELRGSARRPLFFWLRGLLALAAGFQACELLDRYAIAPGRGAAALAAAGPGAAINGAALLHQMSWLLFLGVLFMGLLTADSITRERRNGTLGLLLMTDLTPAEIVYGKMLSCGLTSFMALLGCLPALMIPVLAGGVNGREAALTGIGLCNSLFVSLAAGLWMSALFRERRSTIAATLAVVAALAFGPEVTGGSFFGLGTVPIFRFLGLAGWMTAARLPLQFSPLFVLWFAATHTLGWVFLWEAAVTLARTWQDQPHQQAREADPTETWLAPAPVTPAPGDPAATPEAVAAAARVSWLTDPRPWDADPIRWRVERLGSAEGLIWLAMALNFFAQIGLLGSVFTHSGASSDSWGFLSFVGLTVSAFAGGLVAWAGARFFQDTRQQQDLELLLTTPIGGRDILASQWRVLVRALAWPVGLVLALSLPAGISLIYDFAHDYRSEPWSLLEPYLIAVNLAFEAVALCWVGMRFGLRGRNAITAVAGAVGLVQLLPLALAVALMWSWAWLPNLASLRHMSRSSMPPIILALLFFLGKNLALILWARFRLHGELRLGSRTTRLDGSAHRLVPQRA
jgi:hypothetical protein